MIQAIISKITSSSVLLGKYNSILNNLNGTFVTNISTDMSIDLVKLQLEKNPSWNVTSISLNGSDGSEYVYSYKKSPLYVMIPNEDTVKNAQDMLEALYSGKNTQNIQED